MKEQLWEAFKAGWVLKSDLGPIDLFALKIEFERWYAENALKNSVGYSALNAIDNNPLNPKPI